MCSDSSFGDGKAKPPTPGSLLDEVLEQKDRDIQALRDRIEAIEREAERLRRNGPRNW